MDGERTPKAPEKMLGADPRQLLDTAYRFAHQLVATQHVPHALVDDIAQESLLSLLGDEWVFRGECSAGTRLFDKVRGATTKVPRQLGRAQRRELPVGLLERNSVAQVLAAPVQPVYAGPQQALEYMELASNVTRAIEFLSEELREAFRVVVLEGTPGKDAARRLGITRAALYVRVHRARVQLARHLFSMGYELWGNSSAISQQAPSPCAPPPHTQRKQGIGGHGVALQNGRNPSKAAKPRQPLSA